jgi:hypothetical protein
VNKIAIGTMTQLFMWNASKAANEPANTVSGDQRAWPHNDQLLFQKLDHLIVEGGALLRE